MSCNINVPPDRSIVAVNTLTTSNKVIVLPAASTVPGRFITIKDYYGNSGSSSFMISTSGTNRIDRYNSSIVISTSFQCLTLISDGLSNWATVANETGPIPLTFLPTQISTPEIWFDASFLPNINYDTATCNVRDWRNRGSFVVAADSNASQDPPKTLQQTQNGLNLLSYQRSNILIIPSMALPGGLKTLFAVYRQNETLAAGRGMNFLQGNNGYNFGDFSFTVAFDGSTGSNLLGTINGGYCFPVFANISNTPNTFNIASLRANFDNDGVGGVWLNGTLLNSTTFCPSDNNGASIPYSVGGGTQDKSAQYDLAEFMIFQYLMSDAEKQRIEGYLAWKWGLRNLLPANHPYKNAVP
jgi:hypothetical protein